MALLAALTSACVFEGGVEIVLHWPEDETLHPPLDEIARLTLVSSVPGEPTLRLVRPMPTRAGESVDMGAIEPGDAMQLAIELRSPTQRLLGYGRLNQRLALSPGDSPRLDIEVRRPFVYMTGGSGIDAFAPTPEGAGLLHHSAIHLDGAKPVLGTSTADGTRLLVVVQKETEGAFEFYLHGVDTSDHAAPVFEPIVLQHKPIDIAVSSLGRHVVLGHANGPDGGVTVVNLQDPLRPVSTYVDLGPVGRVVIGMKPQESPLDSPEERAYALVESSAACDARQSQIVAVDLAEPQAIPVFLYQVSVADIAAVPDSPDVLVANTCQRTLDRVQTRSGSRDILASNFDVQAVTVQDDRIWAVGVVSTDGGARLRLVSVDLDGNGLVSTLLPELHERATAVDYSNSEYGEETMRQITADEILVLDFTVLPGSESVAITTALTFRAASQGNLMELGLGIDLPILPSFVMRTSEFLLVDTVNSTLAQRVRTECDIGAFGPGFVSDWTCSLAANQETTPEQYSPSSMWALFGAR